MLALNGVPLDLSGNKKEQDLTDVERKVLAAFEEIRSKFTFPVRFVHPPHRMVTNPDMPGQKFKRGTTLISYTSFVKSQTGTEKWQYYTSRMPNDKEFEYAPTSLLFDGNEFVSADEIDRFYFLYYLSSGCQNGIEGMKNPVTKHFFRLEDKAAEAKTRVSKKAEEAKFNNMLYNDGLIEKDIRDIAKSFKIRGVDDMTIEEVKDQLDEIIKLTSGGREKFLEYAEGGDTVKRQALVMNAIEGNIIKSEVGTSGGRWMMVDDNGAFNIQFCKIKKGQEPLAAIMEYVIRNHADFLTLEDKTNHPPKV